MKSFEDEAIKIVQMYIDMKFKAGEVNCCPFDPQYEYDINSVDNIACTVNRIADTLAANYRHRAVQWDKENFDREVEKMLTQENQ